MNVGSRVLGYVGIDELADGLLVHARGKNFEAPSIEDMILKRKHDRFITVLASLRQKIEECSEDEKMKLYSAAYFNIMDHGRITGVLDIEERDKLSVELGRSQVKYPMTKQND